MTEATRSPGSGVIVVAEVSIHDLLSAVPAPWSVQERQASVAQMWEGLSQGRLDKRSRVLVFSDSQHAGEPGDEAERQQVARAAVAMANAGARVLLVQWRPEMAAAMDEAIASAAAAQGLDPQRLGIVRLDPGAGPQAMLETMRPVLAGVVDLPPAAELRGLVLAPQSAPPAAPQPPPHAERPSVGLSDLSALGALENDERPGPVAAPREATPIPSTSPARPSLPPLGSLPVDGAAPEQPEPRGVSGLPAQADAELLGKPRLPGQTTITVTSSKGGSGKSTVSVLLAATIARASAQAGAPLTVCLLDLDTRDGQVASLIGKFMPTALNIRVQPVWDEERIRRNLVRAEGLGIDTLLAPIRPRTADTVGPEFYRTIVRSLQRMYDVVIMDTSVQYLEPLIADVAFGESEEILFVTTLASTAIQGMARALREMTAPVDESGLGVPREKIGIIVNQSVANVGMERDQVLAAGLGVPVVGVIPLATRDVLTATNFNQMQALLDHPLLGPAYSDLARACLPGRELAPWTPPAGVDVAAPESLDASAAEEAGRKRGLFRR
jgi:MinD-like ATPase involved in chromosome partitioning or flagellar assembly